MYLQALLLLLALVCEWQVADADCEVKRCVDNKNCNIEFIDCPNTGKHGTGKNGSKEMSVKELDCKDINEFKGTATQYYKNDKSFKFITLTEIVIPESFMVFIGHFDCKRDDKKCKVLQLGPKAVPPIPHLYISPKKQKFKISVMRKKGAQPKTTPTIKFTCERKCHNVAEPEKNPMKRIVDGMPADDKKNRYPFMAYLRVLYSKENKDYYKCNKNGSTSKTEIEKMCETTTTTYECGGSILQKSFVLTAQHCVLEIKINLDELCEKADYFERDKLITCEEFVKLLERVDEGVAKYWFNRFNFNKFTTEQTETLDKQELKAFYLAMEEGDFFTGFHEDIDILFDQGDKIPQDGELTFNEFFDLLKIRNEFIDESIAKHWFDLVNFNKLPIEEENTLDINEFEDFHNIVNDFGLFFDVYTNLSKCVVTYYLVGAIVRVGSYDKTKKGPEGEDIWVGTENVIRSDGYNRITYNNDVALLHLSSAITPNPQFRYPICMPPYYWNDAAELKNKQVTVAGWGDTEDPMIDPTKLLREGKMKVITDADCKIKTSMTDKMICMLQDESKSCHGDSGGPGFCKANDNYFYEIGIISHGPTGKNGNWSNNLPQKQAKVTQFLKWIAKKVTYLP